jgi:hybrid cluster-associated redox disulfide protein
MAHTNLDGALTVARLLRQWPAAAAVFVRRGMSCPGCSMAPFETLVEVAAVYDQEPAGFLAELATSTGVASGVREDAKGRRPHETPPRGRNRQ